MRASLALLILVLSAGWATGGDGGRSLEVAFAETAVTFADDPDWGWWTASKYDEWTPVEAEKREFVEARFTTARQGYSAFLAYETYPTLEALASETDAVTGELTHHELSTELEVYDLGIGQKYAFDRGELMPWIGLTHLRVDERRTSESDPPAGSPLPAETAASHLWGVGVGVEGDVQLTARLAVAARVVWRWGQGDRKAKLPSEDTGTGGPEVTWVELSDNTERTLLGGEAALRLLASSAMWVEGGWRYRDFKHGGGPASFDGPFVRLAILW